MKIKQGDNVVVTTGKDKGRQGKVSRVLPRLNKLIVEGVNLQKRRERSRQQGKTGQTVTLAAPLAASNVLFYCGSCKRGVRLGAKIKGQHKVRICRKCGKEI